jgi:hypothetical protein
LALSVNRQDLDKRHAQFVDPIEGLLSHTESIDLHGGLRIVNTALFGPATPQRSERAKVLPYSPSPAQDLELT